MLFKAHKSITWVAELAGGKKFEQITLYRIKENLSFLDIKYDAVRLVDPLEKRVLEWRRKEPYEVDEDNSLNWEDEVITENSIAIKAYHEKKSYVKLEQRAKGQVMITSIPLKVRDKPFILEFLINGAEVEIVGAVNCDDEQCAQGIQCETNGMATQDGLTMLHNRNFFDERLPHDITDAVSADAPLSVIFIDADDLKKINDTFGHIAGDLALKEIGAAIQRNIRLENDWAARYGGDEFFVSLHNTSYNVAFQIAERIRQEVERITISVPEGSFRLSASLGVHTIKGSKLTADEVISLVDRRMYHAKKNGKNRTTGNSPNSSKNETKMKSTCSLGRNLTCGPAIQTFEVEERKA